MISLGTDKVIKIWDIRTYACIQTLSEEIHYRPEDKLTSLLYDPFTNNILAGSRKVNLWRLITQKDCIKTSHEFPVVFALNNSQFGLVVSADDGGNIAVWDIEDGKQIYRYGDAHGPN